LKCPARALPPPADHVVLDIRGEQFLQVDVRRVLVEDTTVSRRTGVFPEYSTVT